MTFSEEANTIDLDVPPALEHGTLRPMLPVPELIPWPEMSALEQYIAPLSRTRPYRPYDFLGLWLVTVPKGALVISFQHLQ